MSFVDSEMCIRDVVGVMVHVAIGEEHQLHALAQLFVGQEQPILAAVQQRGGRARGRCLWHDFGRLLLHCARPFTPQPGPSVAALVCQRRCRSNRPARSG